MKYRVYILHDGQNRKIGYTSNIDKRMRCLQVGSSNSLKLEHLTEPMTRANARFTEMGAHDSLMALHVSGEWFAVSHEGALEVVTMGMCTHSKPVHGRYVPVCSEPFVSVSDRIISQMNKLSRAHP